MIARYDFQAGVTGEDFNQAGNDSVDADPYTAASRLQQTGGVDGVGVGVLVGVMVGVIVGVLVGGAGVGVSVGTGVTVGIGVSVLVGVGVSVGTGSTLDQAFVSPDSKPSRKMVVVSPR